MPQCAGEGSGAWQKPKSTTEEPMSSQATRHFQKFTPISGGNDGFKKIENLEFLKKVLNSRTVARKLFQII